LAVSLPWLVNLFGIQPSAHAVDSRTENSQFQAFKSSSAERTRSQTIGDRR
jgi:hypothetical protein